jgi:hypothetical protein
LSKKRAAFLQKPPPPISILSDKKNDIKGMCIRGRIQNSGVRIQLGKLVVSSHCGSNYH